MRRSPTWLVLAGLILVSGCRTIPVEIEASVPVGVAGVSIIKPTVRFAIGDGVVGPTDVEIEAEEEAPPE